MFAKRLARTGLYAYRRMRFSPYKIDYSFPDGSSAPFLIRDEVGRSWYDTCAFGRSEGWYRLAARYIRPGDLVLECGPHHGLTTVFLGRNAGRILAIEAHPRNVAAAKENICLNRITGEVINAAVAGESGTRLQFLDSSNSSIVRSREFPQFSVATVALDDFCREHDFWPTFLKMDIEGAEIVALPAAKELLSRRPRMNIEVHCAFIRDNFGRNPDDLWKMLPRGYKWELQLDDSSAETIPETSFQPYSRVELWGEPC